jgi:hypothetical protein
MSGHSPSAQSPERFELERILSVKTVEGIVRLSVQVAYDPWDGGSIYDHLHALNGMHQMMIAASVRAEAERHSQYDDLHFEIVSHDG